MPTKKKSPAKSSTKATSAKAAKPAARRSGLVLEDRLQTLLFIFAIMCLAFFAAVVWRYHA